MSATTSRRSPPPPDRAAPAGRRIGRTFALAGASVVALVMLPLVPHYAVGGLDYSWIQALQVAHLRGFAFGSEIVFTFGPLGFALPRLYWPGTFAFVLFFWAVVAAGLLEAWSTLAARTGWEAWIAWPVFVLLCVFTAMFIHEAAPLAYLLLLVSRVEADPPGPGTLAAHGAAVGVIALSKLTLTIAGGLAIAAIAVVLCLRGRQRHAVAAPAAAAAAFLAGWLALSQPLAGLPRFFHGGWLVVSGYGQAMALPGPAWEIVAYAAFAAVLLGIAAVAAIRHRDAALGAGCALALALFVLAGKHAFTRHGNHAYLAFTFLAFASLALSARVSTSGRALAALALASVVASTALLAYVTHVRSAGNGRAILQAMAERPAHTLRNVRDAISGHPPWPAVHEQAIARQRQRDPLPALPGSVDVYSHDQAVVFAHDLRWQPRPVFQSYGAYSAELAELNRRHLLGEAAPDHLLVRIQPIDGRLPAMEDGASWLAMLERYALRDDAGFAILDRQPRAAPARLEPLAPWTGSGWRELPRERLLLASIKVREPGASAIHVRTIEGDTRTYRFLPSVAQAPFVLSPLVRSDADFASLFAPCPGEGIGPPGVQSVRISDASGRDLPYTLEMQAARELPLFAASVVSGPRSAGCKLKLLSGADALRAQPFLADGPARGVHAHPPATFGFTRPASRVNVCTRLASTALDSGSDGYALSLWRKGAATPAAQMRVTRDLVAGGREACIEARFGEPVADAELHVGPGGHDHWDWVYITRVDLDG